MHGNDMLYRKIEKLIEEHLKSDTQKILLMANTLKGEMVFCGKVGKNIEEKKDKKDQSYTMFSAFSTEKVADGFEYQWVRFFCFNRQREEWLQPGVKIDAKGEMGLTVHNGKPNVSCRVEELTQCVADSSNSNQ